MSFEEGHFHDKIKLAEVSPYFEKKDDLNNQNHRLMSVLPQNVRKLFARIMYRQINDSVADKLSKQLTGFSKNHSTQLCLISMLEMGKKILDQRGYICAISWTCQDTLNHDLLIAKLGAYGFETDALRYMKNYSVNRKQRGRVNKNFNEWKRITTGVPQGSILGHALFNIILNDLFLFVSDSFLGKYAVAIHFTHLDII